MFFIIIIIILKKMTLISNLHSMLVHKQIMLVFQQKIDIGTFKQICWFYTVATSSRASEDARCGAVADSRAKIKNKNKNN